MAIVVTDNKHYINITTAIREKTGKATTYKPEEIPVGIDEVYEAGKQAEYDRFWDAYQLNGTREMYNYAFYGYCWTIDNFTPKYDIKGRDYSHMFEGSMISGDLTEILANNGVSIDFTGVTNMGSMFKGSRFSIIGTVQCTGSIGYQAAFQDCLYLEKIEKLIIAKNQRFSSTFSGSTKLKELYIEGTIGNNGLTLSQCTLLTHDSLMSVINCLADYSSSTSTYKVTLGSTNIAKLTADELLIAENKGWTVA